MTGPRIVAAVLAALAVAILVTTFTYPPGARGVPGPAMMPRGLGLALLATALFLLRFPGTGAPPFVRHRAAVLTTMAALAVYAVLWRVVPYGVLTGAFVLVFLRLTGLHWRGATIAAVVMATILSLLFEQGLGVRF